MSVVRTRMISARLPGVSAWYASFEKKEEWIVVDEFHVTRRELASFEELGRKIEIV
jgi:hypothetical protein